MSQEREKSPQDIQRKFYAEVSESYDKGMLEADSEHMFSLALLSGLINYFRFESLLDVGAGTGRAQRYLKSICPGCVTKGIEPVAEMREVAYKNGIPRDELVSGDGAWIEFPDGSFDVATEFGILHHVAEPRKVISEMLRVSRRAIFISDSNCFGQGPFPVRLAKQVLHALGLWRLTTLIRSRGKGYLIGGEGLFYPYSVFMDYSFIKRNCRRIMLFNTSDAVSPEIERSATGINPYRTARHVTLLALK